jgi:hypothetical protein
VTGRQSIPGQGDCSNRRQLNSSRKGRQDSYAKVQTVQAGRGPGGWSWLDPSAGLERGRCAQPPQVWHIVPNIDKIFDIEEKPSTSLYPDNRYHVRHQSFNLRYPYITILQYDIATVSKLRYRIECTKRIEIELEYRTRYPRFFFDIEPISSVQRWSFFLASSISYPISYTISMPIYNFQFQSRSQCSTSAVD